MKVRVMFGVLGVVLGFTGAGFVLWASAGATASAARAVKVAIFLDIECLSYWGFTGMRFSCSPSGRKRMSGSRVPRTYGEVTIRYTACSGDRCDVSPRRERSKAAARDGGERRRGDGADRGLAAIGRLRIRHCRAGALEGPHFHRRLMRLADGHRGQRPVLHHDSGVLPPVGAEQHVPVTIAVYDGGVADAHNFDGSDALLVLNSRGIGARHAIALVGAIDPGARPSLG